MITLSPGFRRLLGLRGSWKWAMRRMHRGWIMTRGGLLYRMDQNTFLVESAEEYRGGSGWSPAHLFYDDFQSVEWRVAFKKPML